MQLQNFCHNVFHPENDEADVVLAKLLNFLSKKFYVFGASLNPKQSIIRKVDAINKKEVEDFLAAIKPDIVINTIALSSYLKCEQNGVLCNKLNYITCTCNIKGYILIF